MIIVKSQERPLIVSGGISAWCWEKGCFYWPLPKKALIHECDCHLLVEIQLQFSIAMSLKMYLKDIYKDINTYFAYSGNQTEEKSSFQNIFFKVSEDYF